MNESVPIMIKILIMRAISLIPGSLKKPDFLKINTRNNTSPRRVTGVERHSTTAGYFNNL